MSLAHRKMCLKSIDRTKKDPSIDQLNLHAAETQLLDLCLNIDDIEDRWILNQMMNLSTELLERCKRATHYKESHATEGLDPVSAQERMPYAESGK